MTKFFNNPIVHAIVTFVAVGLGWIITSGEPFLSITIGAILKGIYTWLVQVEAE